MVVALVEDCDVERRTAQTARDAQTPEAGADDDDGRPLVGIRQRSLHGPQTKSEQGSRMRQ